MRNPFRSSEFHRLREHWYQKLSESGFKDCETLDPKSGEMMLRDRHSHRFLKPTMRHLTNTISREATIQYFDMAVHLLGTFEFETHLQLRIWRFHAHGYSLRQIGRMVGKDKDHVHGVVRVLRGQMLGKA